MTYAMVYELLIVIFLVCGGVAVIAGCGATAWVMIVTLLNLGKERIKQRKRRGKR